MKIEGMPLGTRSKESQEATTHDIHDRGGQKKFKI